MCVSLKCCVDRTGALKKKKGAMMRERKRCWKQMDFRIVFFEL